MFDHSDQDAATAIDAVFKGGANRVRISRMVPFRQLRRRGHNDTESLAERESVKILSTASISHETS
jgi:hypothetical protein